MSSGPPSKRVTVCMRDGAVCHYCSSLTSIREGTVDHIVPEVLGGVDANWNLVWACKPCNEAKGAVLPSCRCSICAEAFERWCYGERSAKARGHVHTTARLSYSIGDALVDAGMEPPRPARPSPGG